MSMTTLDRQLDATEFQRRRNLPGATVRHMTTDRCQDVVVEYQGICLAQKTIFYSRGKPKGESYFIPPFPPRATELMGLPRAR